MEDESTTAEAAKATSEDNPSVEADVPKNPVAPVVEDASTPAAVPTPDEATGTTLEDTSNPTDGSAANLTTEADENVDGDGDGAPAVMREPSEETIPTIVSIKSMHDSDSLLNVISSAIISEYSQIPLNIAEFE